MINVEYEKTKIRREIQSNGETFVFMRNKKDEYNQPLEEVEQIGTVDGLFHVSKGYISQIRNISGHVQTKGQSFIMIVFDDFHKVKDLDVNDFVIIHGERYKVNGKNNIGLLDVAIDISLERVL